MMANRSIRYRGIPATGSSTTATNGVCADLIGTLATETIKASGQLAPRKQAGHMTALDHAKKTIFYLQIPGRPHMTPILLNTKIKAQGPKWEGRFNQNR